MNLRKMSDHIHEDKTQELETVANSTKELLVYSSIFLNKSWLEN